MTIELDQEVYDQASELFQSLGTTIDGNLGVQLESAELEQQGDPVQDGMVSVQQVQHL